MRVLHFYKTAFPDSMGGVEQVISQIARGSNKLGVKTDVLSLTQARVPRTIEMDGYLAHRTRLNIQIASTGISASVFLRFAGTSREKSAATSPVACGSTGSWRPLVFTDGGPPGIGLPSG